MKPSRSWQGKPALKRTPKQQAQWRISWSLFVIGGAIGTLGSLKDAIPPRYAASLREILQSLKFLQRNLRHLNLIRQKGKE